MPQATFQKTAANVGRTVRFGGLARPNGQGVMSYVNLNDWSSWFLQDINIDTAQEVQLGRMAWRGRGAGLGADWPPASFNLAMEYREVSAPLGAAIAQLAQSGRQYLTFDQVSVVPVRFAGVTNRAAVVVAPLVPRWSFNLEFSAEQQFWTDLFASSLSPVTLASGSATTFSIAYAGSVFAEPIWTLTIPGSNPAPIASFQLSNTMSGEMLVVSFPGNLPALTAATVTIDASAFTITDATGKAYDNLGGAFPMLYGPAGQSNPFSATLTPASGTATGCTLSASWANRWML